MFATYHNLSTIEDAVGWILCCTFLGLHHPKWYFFQNDFIVSGGWNVHIHTDIKVPMKCTLYPWHGAVIQSNMAAILIHGVRKRQRSMEAASILLLAGGRLGQEILGPTCLMDLNQMNLMRICSDGCFPFVKVRFWGLHAISFEFDINWKNIIYKVIGASIYLWICHIDIPIGVFIFSFSVYVYSLWGKISHLDVGVFNWVSQPCNYDLARHPVEKILGSQIIWATHPVSAICPSLRAQDYPPWN